VERICEQFELCPKYCHLQSNVTTCFHYQIKRCRGICRGKENAEGYNQRVEEAITHIRGETSSCVIEQEGRQPGERSFVLIENGVYLGFGYISADNEVQEPNEMQGYREYLNPQQDNRDIQRILRSFMSKNPNKITYVLSHQNHQEEGGVGTLFSGQGHGYG
jgi:DNA polymerase-3 subunit epsilon